MFRSVAGDACGARSTQASPALALLVLCWRFMGPTSAITPDIQNVQIIVTAVQGT